MAHRQGSCRNVRHLRILTRRPLASALHLTHSTRTQPATRRRSMVTPIAKLAHQHELQLRSQCKAERICASSTMSSCCRTTSYLSSPSQIAALLRPRNLQRRCTFNSFSICVSRLPPADSLDQRLVAAARRESACSSIARVSSEARARARPPGANMRAALSSSAARTRPMVQPNRRQTSRSLSQSRCRGQSSGWRL